MIIVLAAGGVWFFINKPFAEKPNNDANDAKTDFSQEYLDFQTCLNSIDTTEISIDDTDFWTKHIDRYEETISCYNEHPNVSSISEKNDFEDALSELRENSTKAEANDVEYRQRIAANEKHYQEKMAEINAELSENLTRIEQEGKAWDEELSRRIKEREAEAERQRAEYQNQRNAYEQQQTAAENSRKQQEQAAKAKCDDYLAKYGSQTTAEIAESDPEVRSAKNTLNEKTRAYTTAYNNLYKSNVVLTEGQKAPLKEKYETAKSEMNAAEYNYKTILNQKTSYYQNLRINSCGY